MQTFVPEMTKGSQPSDGGNLLLNADEAAHIRATDPDEGLTQANIKHLVYRAHSLDKDEVIARILQAEGRGLTIIFTRPFHVGDYISIAKEEGEVLDINLFSTTLGHTDRSKVIIPNRKIVGEILHNCGQIRRLPLLANVAYGTDIATALALVNEVLAGNERVLKTPAPVVGVARLTDACVSININPWVNVPDYEAAISEINQAVLAAFRAHGIVIPLPQREVRML